MLSFHYNITSPRLCNLRLVNYNNLLSLNSSGLDLDENLLSRINEFNSVMSSFNGE